MRFEGKVTVVTGGASGLGRAIAQRMASEGATVVAVDLNESGLEDTAAMLTSAGATVSTSVADVSDRMAAHGVVADAMDRHGRIDVLVNCAGVLRAAHLGDVDEALYDLVMGVNLAGTLWMSQAAIPHLLETGGNVVNVASNAGLMGQAYASVYCASKGAVVNLTRSMAMEFARTAVRINAVAPGGMATPMAMEAVFPDDTDWKLMTNAMGFRGMSEPSEVAAVIAFVASEEAAPLHGAIVSADLGLTAA
ncbi:MAG: SDR family oxidoreductase [Microthrixaceae bacterium]